MTSKSNEWKINFNEWLDSLDPTSSDIKEEEKDIFFKLGEAYIRHIARIEKDIYEQIALDNQNIK